MYTLKEKIIDIANQKKLIRLMRKYFSADKIGKYIFALVRLVLLIGIAFIILNPILVKISNSIKSAADFFDPTVWMVPKNATLKNYIDVIKFIPYWGTLLKTLVFTSANGILQTISCTLVAYGIARFKFKGRNLLFALIILTLAIPAQTVLLPLYLQFKSFSFAALFSIVPPPDGIFLLNTYLPFFMLSITAMGIKNGLLIYILRQFFRNMPVVLEEAAYIDGCGIFGTFARIMLPGSLHMLVTVFLFSFVWSWNDYLYTGFLGQSMKIMSAQIYNIGYHMVSAAGNEFDYVLEGVYNNSAMILHIVPLIILYIFAQRFFVQSIERSGIVG